ncbi:hypothetical protein ABFS82_04G221800 [Erythranthe guttata]
MFTFTTRVRRSCAPYLFENLLTDSWFSDKLTNFDLLYEFLTCHIGEFNDGYDTIFYLNQIKCAFRKLFATFFSYFLSVLGMSWIASQSLDKWGKPLSLFHSHFEYVNILDMQMLPVFIFVCGIRP